MYKKIFLIEMIILPYILNASLGDKLSDGSCNFDIGTGYTYTKVYANNQQEVYTIFAFNDPRYGTMEYVYNGKTCKLVTSGSADKSNFDRTIEEKGFSQIIYSDSRRYGSIRAMDKGFGAVTTLTFNSVSDNTVNLSVASIDNSLTNDLNNIFYSLTNRNAPLQLPTNNDFNNNINLIEDSLIQQLNSIYLRDINFNNFSQLIEKFPNLTKLKISLSNKVNKYIATNVLTVSDIPDTEKVLHGYEKISKNYLKKYMSLKDFGKKLYFDTLYRTIEFQYIFRKMNFDITFDEGGSTFITLVLKQPFSNKYNLDVTLNNFDVIKTDTKREVRKANTGAELLITLFAGGNRMTKTINYYKTKPKNGYLEKMKQTIVRLNPDNKDKLLKYLENKTEWNHHSKGDIGVIYVAPPPPTKEELKIQEMDRMRNERNERDRQRKKEGLNHCYSNCLSYTTRDGGFIKDSSRTNCRQECRSIWR